MDMHAGGRSFVIATLPLDNGGRVGVCGLPGLHGGLSADVKVMVRWQPSIVLSVTEQTEMDACGIGDPAALLFAEGIAWEHMPIGDFGRPTGARAAAWPDLSRRLHDILDNSGGVLVHCRGGQGRSGMIALRLLVERGEDAEMALRRLRHERPGAVETDGQLSWATVTG